MDKFQFFDSYVVFVLACVYVVNTAYSIYELCLEDHCEAYL